MKALHLLLSGLFLLGVSFPAAAMEEPSAKDLLRDGLFEEEANGNLEEAEKAYRQLVERYDVERRYAGTALFRMAEIARKKNDQEKAAALYRRVAVEFSGQEEIAARARDGLAALGAGRPEEPPAGGAMASAPEEAELARVKGLKKNSPDLLDGLDDSGSYPLHKAAAAGWDRVIDYLLEEGVTVDCRSSRIGMTPLHMAVAHGRLAVVRKLLAAGADHSATFSAYSSSLPVPPPSSLSSAGGTWTPMHLAVAYNRKEVAEALIAAGAELNGWDVYAMSRETRRGDHVSTKRSDYSNPLMLAMWLDAAPMVDLLLEKDAPVNAVGYRQGRTALLYAVESRRKYVKQLLEEGATPNPAEKSSSQPTPLYVAVGAGDLETVKALLEAGADPQDSHGGSTVLERAVGSVPDLIDVLLEAGAKPTIEAFELAMRSGAKMDILRKLLAADKDGSVVKTPLEDGRTLLHLARTGEVAELLIDAGLDVNAEMPEFGNVLSTLARFDDSPENRALADLLLARGVDATRFSGRPEDSRIDSPPTSASPGRKARGVEDSLVPYILEKVSYRKRLDPKAIRVSLPNRGWIFDGEVQVIEGTPAPTIAELLGGEQNAPTSGALGRLRVMRLVEGELKEVAIITGEDLTRRPEMELPQLRWGDLVEVTQGLSGGTDWFRGLSYRYEPRTVTFMFGPWTEKVKIDPSETSSYTRIQSSVYLNAHFSGSSRLLDLSKVVVRRSAAPPCSLDLTQEEGVPRLRLLDGDVIEVGLLPRPEDGSPSWDGVRIFQPDRPGQEIPPGLSQAFRPKTIFELLRSAGGWAGGRDLTKIEIRRADGSRIAFDAMSAINKLPVYQWTAEKLAASDIELQDGDLVIVPPEADVAWERRASRMPMRGSKLESFLKALFPDTTPTGSPARTVPTRTAPPTRRRVVPPPPSR